MEKNKKTLTAALKKLPQYTPPETVWQHIDQEITYRQNLDQLPQYTPPASVWNAIEADLARPRVKTFRFPIRKVIAYAALVCGVALGWYWLGLDKAANVEITYSEEQYQAVLLAQDWDEDEAAIEIVVKEFDHKSRLEGDVTNPNSLKVELQELNEAKEELEQLMKRYGQDAAMVSEISKIELERTSVIKQMAAAI
ncbi:MAG: hypothetical protein DHS20C18_15560 [Saprospiraceae bacterium]|nr:MAG: hypothetical protein DHS20C18_15560 [Saprospiraceae bacterium]